MYVVSAQQYADRKSCKNQWEWPFILLFNFLFYFILFYLFYLIIKPEKNSGLNEILTHDLCDTGAVFYQLNYQANWELAMHFVNS